MPFILFTSGPFLGVAATDAPPGNALVGDGQVLVNDSGEVLTP